MGEIQQFKQSKQLFYSDAHFSLAWGKVALLWHILPAGEGVKIVAKVSSVAHRRVCFIDIYTK